MKTQSEKSKNALISLKCALACIREEVIKAQRGEIAIDSENHLELIACSLEKMINNIENDCLPPLRERSVGLWRLVIDTWPYNSDLRKKIVDAELLYDRLNSK